MANALVNGTNYQVGGGKALIDGTVYSIMTVKEVENTVVVSGEIAKGAFSTELIITDERLDYSKYKVKQFQFTSGYGSGSYGVSTGNVLFMSYIETLQLVLGYAYGGYCNMYTSKNNSAVKGCFDFSTNGQAKFKITPSYWDFSSFYAGGMYTIVLEAKT